MSRNLGITNCRFCHDEVRMTEPPREATRADVGACYDTDNGYGYQGMILAHAECVTCCAKYTAWVSLAACAGYWSRRVERNEYGFFDLSFRSTFNDEPGERDLPDFKVEYVLQKTSWPTCEVCGKKIYEVYGCRCEPL
jgi:hypothetical protein